MTKLLQYCVSHHKLCGYTSGQEFHLRLIDCDSLSVVTGHSSCSYAALSYVWSPNSRANQEQRGVSANSPSAKLRNASKTIQDAIRLTKALGVKYLWVDRYCIDQQNPDETYNEVRKMGLIYKRAYFTIIAAAGEDENHGLPGIGTTCRTPQPKTKAKDVIVFSTTPDPYVTITDSAWWTRAWTYPEGVLS